MNIKQNKLALIVALSVMASASASAATVSDVQNDSGFWVGGAQGVTMIDSADFTDSVGMDHSAANIKLKAGYDINKNVAVFVAYDALHNIAYGQNKDLGTIGLKGSYELPHNFSVYGNVGAVAVGSHHFTEMVGVGAEYHINPAFSVNAGYDYYNDLHLLQHHDTDAHNLYVGVSYKFGQPTLPVIKYVKTEIVKEVVTNVDVLTRTQYVMPFAVSSYKLNEQSDFYLNEVANNMQQHASLKAVVTGRTDKTGTVKGNAKLATERASAVAEYLVNHGIDAARISIAPNTTQPLNVESPKVSQLERSVSVTLAE